MRRSTPVARFLSLAALAAPMALAMPAMAQRGPMTPPPSSGTPAAPPPALPGLAARTPAPAIPPDANFNNLGPNEQLFDSINRGDIVSARDAVSRGADLNSRNVLGLTPLESAVDQQRNDIAFFLLSARGPGMSAPPAPPPQGLGRSAPPPPSASRVPARREVPAPRATQAERPAAPRPPVGGGAAQPDVGFLGFDAGRGG
ncbi:hypothetical protein IBL26_15485 [Roseomonas aerophila]|uniref:Ankyrin repeat domain-containing protein n=1 Tax=Teichococcus aerophilus TaxID=1224513 RepID=A0ABR7RPH8_9PROT|nr:hypothetical protein [Pseudoroseomonas aerophila]MBC9208246.1 hypothetical protein [Pseudoroseomonas aerophila]